MTEKQRKFIDFIKNFTEAHGFPPSVREIAKGIGVSSPSTVQEMIIRLVEKGLLKQDALKARTLEVTSKVTGIPLLGTIKAGSPTISEENFEGFIQIKLPQKNCSDCFFLKVDGDSMKDKGIIDGDLVLIKKDTLLSTGAVGAFRLNNEVTLKTFTKNSENHILLVPENKDYSPIPVNEDDDFEVIGRMVTVIRDLENIFDINN